MQHPSLPYFAALCMAALAAIGALTFGHEVLQLQDVLNQVATILQVQ